MKDDIRLNFSDGNKFYIFGDIDESIPEFIIAPMLRYIEDNSTFRAPKGIDVYISSDGGLWDYAQDIISVFDIALFKGIKVNTIVTSHAYSAASLIAVCGHHRVAYKNASHLIHYARGSDFSHNDIMAQRNLESTKFSNNAIVNIYRKNTKLKNIDKLLLADNYMVHGAEALKKLGFIDEIL